MGGPIENKIKAFFQGPLARIFPEFKEKVELQIATNHISHMLAIGLFWLVLAHFWNPFVFFTYGNILLIVIAEYKKGRWVDVATRGFGWLIPAILATILIIRM